MHIHCLLIMVQVIAVYMRYLHIVALSPGPPNFSMYNIEKSGGPRGEAMTLLCILHDICLYVKCTFECYQNIALFFRLLTDIIKT